MKGRVAAMLVTLLIAGTASADADITITNDSKFGIDQFFLSPTDTNDWGPDQLGADVIETGDSFTLKGVPADKYDVKLVDADGDECVVEDVKIAADEAVHITDQNLIGCQAETEAEGDEE
jgi:hypothetical protein